VIHRERVLDSYGESEDADALNAVAWTCALSPAWTDNTDLHVQLAERSVAKFTQSSIAP
jgi:hypothetical protein